MNCKIDISMVDLNEYLKYRKCTIAVIDSGINIENAILKKDNIIKTNPIKMGFDKDTGLPFTYYTDGPAE